MSYIKSLLESKHDIAKESISQRLDARVAYVIEHTDRSALMNIVLDEEATGCPSTKRPADQCGAGVEVADPSGLAASGEGIPDENETKTDTPVEATGAIQEMRDLPDQSMYPLTRREVEKLLASYERRSEEKDSNIDDIEARTEEGMRRATWFPPEVKSDYKPDPADDMYGTDKRPAKLMPFDYNYTVASAGDSDTTPASSVEDDDGVEDESKKQDYSGEHNMYFGDTK